MGNPQVSGDSGASNLPYEDYTSNGSPNKNEQTAVNEKNEAQFYDTIESASESVNSSSDDEQVQTTNSFTNPLLVNGGMSSTQYARILFDSNNNFKHEVVNSALMDAEISKRLLRGLSDAINESTKHSIDKVHKEWTALTDVVNTVDKEMNKAIDKYNYGVSAKNPNVQTEQSMTEAMNKDIDAYNNGEITSDEMSEDIDQYNTYASQRNQEIDKFNDMIDAYNKFVGEANLKIDDINSQLDALGYTGERIPHLATIPNVPEMPILDNPPGDPPLQPLPERSTVDPVIPMPPPPSTGTIQANSTVVQSEQQSTVSALKLAEISLTSNSKSLEFMNSLLKTISNMIPVLPTIVPMQKEYDSVTKEVVGYSQVIKGVSARAIDAMNARDLIEDSFKKFGVPFGDQNFTDIAKLNTTVMAQNGLIASTATVAKIGDALWNMKQDDSSIAIAGALSVVEGVNMIVESDLLREPIHEILNENPSFKALSSSDQEAFTNQLTAISNLSLLNSAVAQLSMTMRTPGLTNQVVGLSAGRNTAGRSSFNDVIDNPAIQTFVGSFMANTLQKGFGFTQNSASKIAMDSIRDAAASGPFSSIDSYAGALTSQLKLNGVENTALARSLSVNAVNDFGDFVTKDDSAKSVEAGNVYSQSYIETQVQKRSYGSTFSKELTSERNKSLLSGLDYQTSKGVVDAADIAVQLGKTSSPELIALALQRGGLDEELSSVLGSRIFESVQASSLSPLSQQAALSLAAEELLTNTLMVDPHLAGKAVKGLKGATSISSDRLASPIVQGLVKGGMNAREASLIAKSVADKTLSVPGSYKDESALKSTASIILQGVAGLDRKSSESLMKGVDINGVIDRKAFEEEISKGIREGGVDRERADALSQQAADRITEANISFNEQLAETLRVSMGIDSTAASLLASQVKPEDVIDRDVLQNNLEISLRENSLDGSAAKPIVGQMLQLGSAYMSLSKFAETMRDLLVSDLSIDPKQAKQISEAVSVEGVIKRESIKEALLGALVVGGISEEKALSMAGRGSDSFMRIASNATEFNGIASMALEQRAGKLSEDKFLSSALSNILKNSGMPEVYAKRLGHQLSADIYSNPENLKNFASLQEALKTSLEKVIDTDSFPVDINTYLGKVPEMGLISSLGLIPPLRNEIIAESVKHSLISGGVDILQANFIAAKSAEIIVKTYKRNSSEGGEIRDAIKENLLLVTTEENAQLIADTLSFEIFEDIANPLTTPFSDSIVANEDLQISIVEKSQSLLKGLGSAKANQLSEQIAATLLNSPSIEKPSELPHQASFVELYQQQIETIIKSFQDDEMKEAFLDNMMSNVQKFATPSMEMYDLLQRLMDPPNLMARSMMQIMKEAREQQEDLSISLRQNA